MPGLLFVSYSGMFGGAERVLLECVAAAPAPAVLACPPGALAQRARTSGATVLELRGDGGLELRGGVSVRLAAVAALVRHARAARRAAAGLDPDLVVTWGMRSAIAWRLAMARRRAVIAHHDFLPGPFIGRLMGDAARRAAVVVVPSEAVARDLDPRGRLPARRVRVVAPGVDVERFAAAAAAEPAAPPEVVVIGAIAGWKRPDLALEVAAIARRALPDLRVRLIGGAITDSGEALIAALRRRAAEPDLAGAVEIAGAVPDAVAALARATCLLHCAPREPFGLAVVEALAAARPVVVPDAAGPREIVDDACGSRYPPGDAAAAAAAVCAVVRDPERARRAGAAGRARVARRFTRDRMRDEFAAAVEGPLRAAAAERRPVVRAAAQDVTLVTVTHNSADELEVLLRSAARHVPGAQIVVVDSGSSDDSAAVARGWGGATVIELGENVGFGRACNQGLEAARGRAAALVNPDVELVDDSLLALAAEALRGDRPQRLLAPRVLNGDGSPQDTAHPLPASAADVARALVPPTIVPVRLGVALAPWRAETPRRIGWAVGCAMVARTDTLRALGPFHEGTFLYGEDLDLGLHARARGVETWLWPAARVVHRGGHASRRAFAGEPFERLARGRHDAVERRLGPRRAALDDAVQAATFGARVTVKRALGRRAWRERQQLAAVLALRGRT